MPHRRHREIVDMLLKLGQRLASLQSSSPDELSTEDLYRIVAVFAEKRRVLAERDRLYEEALAAFVAELKHRGKTHEAIQRRMRRPDEKPNAMEITRLLRRWEPALNAGPDAALRDSSFLAVVASAARAQEQVAADPTAPSVARNRARQRADHLRQWIQLGSSETPGASAV